MDQLKHKFHNHILYPLPRFSSAPVFFLRYDGFWTVGSGHVLSSTWTWTPIFRISSSSTLFGFCNWNLTAADIRNLRERCYILLFAMNRTCLEDNSSPPVLGPCCPIYYQAPDSNNHTGNTSLINPPPVQCADGVATKTLFLLWNVLVTKGRVGGQKAGDGCGKPFSLNEP